MDVGIIGYGIVGKAIEFTMSKKFKVVKYDKYLPSDSFEELLSCSFIFVSVPTPFDTEKYTVDDSAIIESLEKLEKSGFSNYVILKSTVPPGTCKFYSDNFNLKLVFNPEFLRESITPNEDFANQHTVVIGVDDVYAFESSKGMYKKVLPSSTNYYHMSYESAEMVKFSQNMTLASRVAVSNIVFDACSKFNIDYSLVKKVAFDSFDIIGPNMTQVPGPDGKRGFGGKCLPKDTLGFDSIHSSDVVKSIIEYNNSLRDDIPKHEK